MADEIKNESNVAGAATRSETESQNAQGGVSVKSKLPSFGARTRRPSAEAPEVAVPKARRMKLSLTKIDPWSVAKVSFLLSIALGIIQLVAVAILWWLLSAVGIFDQLNTVISSTGLSSSGMDVSSFLGFGQVLSWVTIFAVFEVILIVILATVSAFLYDVVSSLVGGIHLTLGDD
jgi:hypothetical protein